MIRSGSLYGITHTTKPGRGERFRPDSRRLMREDWADYCTNHCPHPAARCENRPCPEFRARFGKVDNL